MARCLIPSISPIACKACHLTCTRHSPLRHAPVPAALDLGAVVAEAFPVVVLAAVVAALFNWAARPPLCPPQARAARSCLPLQTSATLPTSKLQRFLSR